MFILKFVLLLFFQDASWIFRNKSIFAQLLRTGILANNAASDVNFKN